MEQSERTNLGQFRFTGVILKYPHVSYLNYVGLVFDCVSKGTKVHNQVLDKRQQSISTTAAFCLKFYLPI
jgi:hypothetical protein